MDATAHVYAHSLSPPNGALRRGWLVRRTLLAGDVAGLALAFSVAASRQSAYELLAFMVLVPGWIVGAKILGLYDADAREIEHSTVDEVVAIMVLATVLSWLAFAVAQWLGAVDDLAGRLVAFWVLAIVLVTTARVTARAYLRRRPAFRQRALILGTDPVAQAVARKLGRHSEYGVDVIGFADDGDAAAENLPNLIRRLGVDRVIVAVPHQTPEQTAETLWSLAGLDVYVDIVPRLHKLVGRSGRIQSIEDLPLIDLPPLRLSRSSRFVKRCIDIAGSAVALVLALPLFAVVPLLIRLESPGPAYFRQTRYGEGMRAFTILKFRTMRDGVDDVAHREYIRESMRVETASQQNGCFKLERNGEITRVGRFLRRTSLDELPQLVNVLRGQMSLVGPRPCIPYETKFFEPQHFERFLVPAGLTGLWQVSARAQSTFGEALELDVAYVRGWSLGLDVALLLRTVHRVLSRKGSA